MSSGMLTSTNEASTMQQGGKYILNYVTTYDIRYVYEQNLKWNGTMMQ